MGIIALITAAFQGLAAIPKLLATITGWNIDARLSALEKNFERQHEAYSLLNQAKTTEEKANAADALAAAWNKR